MPEARRDPHSKAVIFTPTAEELHTQNLIRELENKLADVEVKEKKLDALIERLDILDKQ